MSNRLAHETSPYLQQHADNPVEWYPWCDEALTLARARDRPILLSIGYSACHWCHVMARESFEDPAVAAVLNRLFVNIKVDREERPDLDLIYQNAHYLLTRRNGGWPLTMFLTPSGVPFAGGTYFPKTTRHGIPGFEEVATRIEAAYRSKRNDIERQNYSMLEALSAHVPRPPEQDADLASTPLQAAVEAYARMFDSARGGLGQAPKFPHPFEFDLLLRRSAAGTPDCLDMVRKTLTEMAQGGIFDHIGGGFCRYSTDDTWTIPHFEKMLYDNAPLLALYADLACATGERWCIEIVEQTAAWVVREMQAPQGGYYSSVDADSEHEEGKFYVWTPEAVRALLTEDEYMVAAPHFGLDASPNFEGEHWHLRIVVPLDEIAARNGFDAARCRTLVESARTKLFAAREQRIRPGLDEKILTSWNALMVRGIARAGRCLGRPPWVASARRALRFIHTTMWRDGRLLATHKDGRTHLNAYLDDYAFLLDALIEMLQADFHTDELAFARAVADALLERFEDQDEGGFWFTSHDHEDLIHRPKPGLDNATPSGNGVAARALQRLGHLIGEPRYLASAARTLRLFQTHFEQHAQAFPTLLTALEEHLQPPRIVVLRGPREQVSAWHDELARTYRPYVLLLAIPNGLADLPVGLSHPETPCVNAWICDGVKCLPPLADKVELARMLGERG